MAGRVVHGGLTHHEPHLQWKRHEAALLELVPLTVIWVVQRVEWRSERSVTVYMLCCGWLMQSLLRALIACLITPPLICVLHSALHLIWPNQSAAGVSLSCRATEACEWHLLSPDVSVLPVDTEVMGRGNDRVLEVMARDRAHTFGLQVEPGILQRFQK